MKIGDIVGRGARAWHGGFDLITKSHRVESIVAGDAITGCGRRMRPEGKRGLVVVEAAEAPSCRAGCK